MHCARHRANLARPIHSSARVRRPRVGNHVAACAFPAGSRRCGCVRVRRAVPRARRLTPKY
eukprot:1930894-Prymnesium_polylepis.1